MAKKSEPSLLEMARAVRRKKINTWIDDIQDDGLRRQVIELLTAKANRDPAVWQSAEALAAIIRTKGVPATRNKVQGWIDAYNNAKEVASGKDFA